MARSVYNRNAKEHTMQSQFYMYSLDMLTNVERREREKKKTEERRRFSKFNVKESDSKLKQADRKSKFKEASHLLIPPVRDQLG